METKLPPESSGEAIVQIPAAPGTMERLERIDIIIIIALMLLTFVPRAARLDFPNRMYFDEIYYAKSALEYMERMPDTNSVHPPLGKILMGLFMEVYWGTWRLVSGDLKTLTLFATAWRLGSLILGTLMVPLLYYLAFLLFRKRFICVVSCFLLATDFLHLVQSRIAMLDMYVSFLILAASVFAWRYIASQGQSKADLIICLLLFGLGTATKWNALSTLFGYFFLFVFLAVKPVMGLSRAAKARMYALRALSHGGLILLIVIPAYLATFIPFFTQGRNCTFKQMIANHNTMIQFRYKKEFDHKYISRFYTWPLVIRPMWYLFDEEPLGKTPKAEVFDDEQGTGGLGERFRQFVKPYLVEEAGKAVYGIVAMGSPIFWWTFILFFIEISVKGFARRDPRLLFLFTGYLPQWLLWAGATRGGFIYYMLPCIPFMAVIAAHVLEEWRDTKAGRVMIVGYLVSILLFLLIFFPFLTAYPATIDYFDRLFRFSTWR